MIDRTGWQKAFRAGEAIGAVAVLNAAWDELVAETPGTFNAGMHEPALTEMLCIHLQDTREAARLSGWWDFEVPQGKLDKQVGNWTVTKRKRTDIRYSSNLESPPLSLVFEFKKLSHRKSDRDHYTGQEGMLRFVTGEYSVGKPVAAMVGILTVHRDDTVPVLEKWLNSPDAKAVLYMETADGVQARTPSQLFDCAAFDTEHLRPRDRAPAHGTIVISHLFLDFPDLPRRAAKSASRRALSDALDR